MPANAAKFALPTYCDLGLCTAVNPDPENPCLTPHVLPGSASLCGPFKTPTLRNTATRNVFFHNGVFRSLAQVIDFYNTRDTNPGKWYPTLNGVVQKFNDLPSAYKVFVDNVDVPFGLSPGDTPYMTAQNEADLLCFLETLTDGYVQGVPSTVFDPGTGESDVADYRNNQAMYFLPGETPLVAILDARFSQIMNLPIDHGEGLQVLRYGPGERYTPDVDFLVRGTEATDQSLRRSGQRVSSLVTYLNDVPGGGETTFPPARWWASPCCPRMKDPASSRNSALLH